MTGDEPDSQYASRRVTLRDIARAAGVSHVTVSRALHDNPAVTPARRQEIQRLAREMGYEPDPGLASLVAYRYHSQSVHAVRGTIGWINTWPDPEDLRRHRMFNAYWEGAAAAAHRFGYNLEEIRWPMEYPARRIEQILQARGIRGVLIPPQPGERVVKDVAWSKFCIVRLSPRMNEIGGPIVTGEVFQSTQMAIRQMRDRGYRRIGLVLDMHFDAVLGSNLHGGFAVAQHQLRLKPAVPPFDTGHWGPQGYSKETKARLRRWLVRMRPDAILTCDAHLRGLLDEFGYRVPQDIALAGTNIYDLPISAGIAYDAKAIGSIAVETLTARLIGDRAGGNNTPALILVKSYWHDGDSLPPVA